MRKRIQKLEQPFTPGTWVEQPANFGRFPTFRVFNPGNCFPNALAWNMKCSLFLLGFWGAISDPASPADSFHFFALDWLSEACTTENHGKYKHFRLVFSLFFATNGNWGLLQLMWCVQGLSSSQFWHNSNDRGLTLQRIKFLLAWPTCILSTETSYST